MRIVALLASLMLVAGAAGEQFWIEYDASCGLFPEECGWNRLAMEGGAERSLDDGLLTLDSLAGLGVIDCYGIGRPISLAPGESFVMQWRLRVN
ncbi:MAG: hypothetical protein KBH81_04280 [Phycisphaerae bacterium]|jgi:hypothetical protein|nr:hypothetical protein [Phycisphaerae bacterium]HOO16553.1 hypothetical protein [Phycisphaerae bacterium]HPC21818.1 hypothetical protein [Phycisphaerae bacterium]HRS28851.1 hypothetical protein [Phycisphaerae bacterium]